MLLDDLAADAAVHRKGDGRQHKDTKDNVLIVGVDTDKVHAVFNDGHGKHAQDGAQLAALAAGQLGAAQGAGRHNL